MKEKWMIAAKKADFKEIGEKFHINQVTARLIRNRDVVGEEAIRQYLYGGLEDMHNPHLMRDMDRLITILTEKIRQGRKIRIMGDYDIDGVCATYILLQGIKHCGGIVDSEIPDRIADGYGISDHMVELAAEDSIDTIITCDNGIAAVHQVEYAKKMGMTILVTDHHEVPDVVPQADAIVNPHQKDCGYPYKNLCGGAVAFKVVCALYEAMDIPVQEAYPLIEFAGFATVGDVMDLDGENRILVKEGLKRLNATSNIGMRALIQQNGLDEAEISSYHIGFVLGPCINASGRLSTAKKALSLLCTKNKKEAASLAAELIALNDERKTMTQAGVKRAMEIIESEGMEEDRVLVVYLPDCHESLAGIIAGRIRERFYKPAFVLTDGEEWVKGSGRSTDSYNMFLEMKKIDSLFLRYGGHPMAAGLSIAPGDVERFRQEINRVCTLGPEDMIPKILIDVPMPLDYISEEVIGELSLLEPFGKGNTKPVFAERELHVLKASIIGKNRNVLKMLVQNKAGVIMDALYFGDTEEFTAYVEEKFGRIQGELLFQNRSNGVILSFTYYPSVNEFRGERKIQIIVQNYQ